MGREECPDSRGNRRLKSNVSGANPTWGPTANTMFVDGQRGKSFFEPEAPGNAGKLLRQKNACKGYSSVRVYRHGVFLLAARQTFGRRGAISEPRINDRIRVPEVRLVGPAGEQVGVVRVEDALRLAEEAGLDLVEVAPEARPPVAKLMDFGKYKYEAGQKARDARRNQANTQLKEIRFRIKIDDHDFETKTGHVRRFLEGGDKVKVMIMFRGREQSRPEAGIRLLQRLAEQVQDISVVESQPRQDGRNMTMVLGPVRRKADAMADQRERRQAARAQRQAKHEERTAREQVRQSRSDF